MHVALFSVVVGFLAAVPAMGPSSAISIRRILTGRERRGLAFAGGYILAEGLACFAALWGVDLVMGAAPFVEPLLRWVGIVLMFGVGVAFSLGYGPTDVDRSDRQGSEPTQLGGDFALGFGMTAFNPALIASWSTVVGVAVSVTGVELLLWHKWAIPVGVIVGECLWYAVLVAIARRLQTELDDSTLEWLLRAVGVVLVALGLWAGLHQLLPA